MATPASTQAAKNTGSDGASAIPTTGGTARTDPVVMIRRGPNRSIQRPTGIPTSAETTNPVENAAVSTDTGQPVSRAKGRRQRWEGVVEHAPADDLGHAQHDQHPAQTELGQPRSRHDRHPLIAARLPLER
jgi:hypothetical protein